MYELWPPKRRKSTGRLRPSKTIGNGTPVHAWSFDVVVCKGGNSCKKPQHFEYSLRTRGFQYKQGCCGRTSHETILGWTCYAASAATIPEHHVHLGVEAVQKSDFLEPYFDCWGRAVLVAYLPICVSSYNGFFFFFRWSPGGLPKKHRPKGWRVGPMQFLTTSD